jgi:F-type H+-transporting ATPase subunit b
MSVLAFVAAAAHDETQTPSKFWPEGYEMLFGIPASIIVFALLWKFAGPVVRKGMAGRTARIQAELDTAETTRAEAEAEASQIRRAKGDINAERERLLAEADAQAAALLNEGRERLTQELAELEARADAEIASAAGRAGDELRAEIARLSAAAIDEVVARTLDDSTQQELVESFIAKVGATHA